MTTQRKTLILARMGLEPGSILPPLVRLLSGSRLKAGMTVEYGGVSHPYNVFPTSIVRQISASAAR
jgi:hypothetical protein